MTQVMEPIRQVTADKKISLSRIMVLTDFSGVSDLALRYAVALARRYEAKIYLTHIISPASYQLAEPGLAELTYARMRQAAEEGLGQKHEMLMAIDLPDQLVVSGSRRVEIRNSSEVILRGLDATSWVPPPRHYGAVIHHAIE